jgi:hypothetical protein
LEAPSLFHVIYSHPPPFYICGLSRSSPLPIPKGSLRGTSPSLFILPLSCDTSSGEGDTGGEVDKSQMGEGEIPRPKQRMHRGRVGWEK